MAAPINPNVAGPIPQLQSSADRLPIPLLNAFRPFVMQEMTRRKTDFPPPTVAPFVRLTSCQFEPNKAFSYIYFTLGLHGFDDSKVDIFDLSYGGMKRDVVGYAYDKNNPKSNGTYPQRLVFADEITLLPLTKSEKTSMSQQQISAAQQTNQDIIKNSSTLYALGTHPIPGIVDVRIDRQGIGTPYQAEVKWRCYNRAQLEFLRNHFMCASNHVVLEFGNQFSDKSLTKLLNFSNESTTRNDLVQAIVNGRSHIIDTWCAPNDGNYDFIVGAIANYKVELDAKTGIYDCTTSIVSVGEQMYGIKNYFTYVDTTEQVGSQQNQRVCSINDFFRVGGLFDVLVNKNSTDLSLVAGNVSYWTKEVSNINTNATDVSDMSTNPKDSRFISWTFFVNTILPNLFAIVVDKNTKDDLYTFTKFLQDATSDPNQVWWVGDNQYLKSTDPDVMVLVKKNMSVPSAYLGNGYFDDNPNGNGYRGTLSRGVWINCGMIRQAFLSTNNFSDSIKNMLDQLNNATAGYWNLTLYYDDEVAQNKIIDMSFGSLTPPTFYKFNVGGFGELLNIELDSAFPPELVAMMKMIAKFRTESPLTQQQLLTQIPKIGTSSPYGVMLNYCNLEDTLDSDLRKYSQNAVKKPVSDNLTAITVGTDNGQVNNTRTISRVGNTSSTDVGSMLISSKNTVQSQPLGMNSATTENTANPVLFPKTSMFTSSPPPSTVDDVKRVSTSYSRLDPDFSSELILLLADIRALGHTVQVTETYRTKARQDYLYAQGRTRSGKIITGVTGDSQYAFHTKGQAADLLIDGSYDNTQAFHNQLAILASARGLQTINPSFGDYGHVQLNTKNLPQTTFSDPSDFTSLQLRPDSISPTDEATQAAQQEEDDLAQKLSGIATRFGDEMISMIEWQPSAMRNKITTHGITNYPTVNNFSAPFPTSTTLSVDILGLSGFSITDGFTVDRLPFIFDRYGCFRIVQMKETITAQGWITTIIGKFILLWITGEGPPNAPINTLPPNA